MCFAASSERVGPICRLTVTLTIYYACMVHGALIGRGIVRLFFLVLIMNMSLPTICLNIPCNACILLVFSCQDSNYFNVAE